MTIAARALENCSHLRRHLRPGLNRLRFIKRRIRPRRANELRYQQQADKNDCEPFCDFERDLHTRLARRLRISQTEITAAAKINGTTITAKLRFPFTTTRVVIVPPVEILRIRGLPSRSASVETSSAALGP